jgi:DNA replication protein DnaC
VQLHHTTAEVEALTARAAREGLSHVAFLHAFVEQEASYREQRRFERLLRESRLPREKTLAQLDLGQFGPVLAQQIERLQSGAFLAQAANVIAVGKPGTGKIHPTHCPDWYECSAFGTD